MRAYYTIIVNTITNQNIQFPHIPANTLISSLSSFLALISLKTVYKLKINTLHHHKSLKEDTEMHSSLRAVSNHSYTRWNI
jgi:hypothetical protein